MQLDGARGQSFDLYGKKIDHRSFVNDVPIFPELRDEFVIFGGLVDGVAVLVEFGGVNHLKVVHVDSDCKVFEAARVVVDEHACVGVIELSEFHCFDHPGKDFSLKAPSRLGDAVNRFEWLEVLLRIVLLRFPGSQIDPQHVCPKSCQ